MSTAQAVRLFQALGDESRLRLLLVLATGKELSVGALCKATGRSQSATSHNLALLRFAGIVTCRREGKQVYYSLASAYVLDLLKTIK
jgi:DNA-binding transcriptional ArsR family regulator